MGDRVPDKAMEAATSELSERLDISWTKPVTAAGILSAALDACPVLGLIEEELSGLVGLLGWAEGGSGPLSAPVESARDKLLAALRSVSEANDG